MTPTNISLKINGVEIPKYEEIKLQQEINKHHSFSITLNLETIEKQGSHTIEKSKEWLGKEVIITIEEEDAQQEFRGIALDVSLLHTQGHQGDIKISGLSNTKKMDVGPCMQSWLEKDLKTIVQEVADANGVKAKVQPKHTAPLEYECQYLESGFEFIQRLAKQYNEWLFYDGTTLHFGKPEASGEVVEIEYGKDLKSINVGIMALPYKQKIFSFNSSANEFHEGTTNGRVAGLNELGNSAFKTSGQLFKNPINFYSTTRVKSKGEIDELLKRKQAGATANIHKIEAHSTKGGLSVGSIIKVKSAMWEMKTFEEQTYGQYIITGISHDIGLGGHYQNNFTAISADVEVLPEPEVAFPVAETQMAKVVSNEDPKKKGRVQVKMNWQTGEMKTSWLRVMTPDGGSSDKSASNRGFVFIPEKGDQVLVGFRYNDPNRPFVMGSLFNGQTGAGGGDGNKSKSIVTRSGNTLTMNDEDGSITMADPSGNTVTMHGDGTITISAPDKINIISKEINLSAEEKVNITGENEVTIGSKSTSVEGTDVVSVSSKTQITEEAPSVSIKGKDTTLIEGKVTDVKGATMTNVKGGVLNLN